ncbi:uncharacterized protein DS421_6g193860 [Arachis hypogaea]|nr:uncharacterized protein DS421_6g193860 [Arachis hypogaea]
MMILQQMMVLCNRCEVDGNWVVMVVGLNCHKESGWHFQFRKDYFGSFDQSGSIIFAQHDQDSHRVGIEGEERQIFLLSKSVTSPTTSKSASAIIVKEHKGLS